MAGLSVVLEVQKDINKKPPQVVNKFTMTKPSFSPPPPPPLFWRWDSPATSFLDFCLLCKQKILPGKDIYMYKGDMAFCSADCRCKRIFVDEEESMRENSSLSATKPTSSSCSSSRHQRIRTRHWVGLVLCNTVMSCTTLSLCFQFYPCFRNDYNILVCWFPVSQSFFCFLLPGEAPSFFLP